MRLRDSGSDIVGQVLRIAVWR